MFTTFDFCRATPELESRWAEERCSYENTAA
jgi:hypothetical protein